VTRLTASLTYLSSQEGLGFTCIFEEKEFSKMEQVNISWEPKEHKE
jgi:hypothetical protein